MSTLGSSLLFDPSIRQSPDSALSIEMLVDILVLVHAIASVLADQQCGKSSDVRIVGGEDVGGYHYPWFALLRLRTTGDPPVCAGSLITPTHVMTAAHCFSIGQNKPNEDLFTVALGVYNRCAATETTREVFTVKRVDVHEEYLSSGKFHDIALMTLDRPAAASVVCLPPRGSIPRSEDGLLVGFGVTKQGNKVLPCRQRQARVTKYSPAQCADTYLPSEDSHEPTVFCGGGQGIDSCQGDSGGPFLTMSSDGRFIASGIVSYGYGCGKIGLPGVYTNVASYLDWLTKKIQKISTALEQGRRNPQREKPQNNKYELHIFSIPELISEDSRALTWGHQGDVFSRERNSGGVDNQHRIINMAPGLNSSPGMQQGRVRFPEGPNPLITTTPKSALRSPKLEQSNNITPRLNSGPIMQQGRVHFPDESNPLITTYPRPALRSPKLEQSIVHFPTK